MKARTERDPLGEKPVPADAYYGMQTARAIVNYPISSLGTPTSSGSSSAPGPPPPPPATAGGSFTTNAPIRSAVKVPAVEELRFLLPKEISKIIQATVSTRQFGGKITDIGKRSFDLVGQQGKVEYRRVD